MKVPNSVILEELTKLLDGMDFFVLYPTRQNLRNYLRDAVSDGDKIRAILRDEYVQRELFPELHASHQMIDDPLHRYLQLRMRR